ncbi:putative arabinosidase [Aspergillus bombycis]|uniref:Putative arabinosidase n=1 Tax=Aspergillus bombycis TaxID=109264 RepID=A0A1F8A7G1_9EURO|nr:putative arabinosidase [Aspergillus bombycis]OGM47646.1 putative arabinosidase [Aspergillus bombycis]
MHLNQLVLAGLALCGSTLASPTPAKRADDKVGYLSVYWTTDDESVYFALSDNDDPLGFAAINSGNAVVSPTLGTKAVRDTSIIAGQGDDAGKYWIIGTDLNIGETTWDAAVRTGSRAIYVWESTDLINWSENTLVTVEDSTAGMVWAPDAIWDPEQGQYFVHWASRFYAADDTEHTGDATTGNVLRYAYTSDFKTFSEPKDYIVGTTDVIDLCLIQLDSNTLLRSYVNSSADGLPVEISTNGLLGDWSLLGSIADSASYEAPYFFADNTGGSKGYLTADLVGSSPGISGWASDDLSSGVLTKDTSHDLTFMRHDSVLAVTQSQYDALKAL